jgi:hypothetical protein
MNPQRRFVSLVLVAMSVMATTGCVCVTTSGARGDVTMLWTFDGRQCGFVPEVAQVTIQIPGQTLENNGAYPCSTAGTGGITLLKFKPGTYNYSAQGRSAAGTVLYQASGSFVVNGNVTVNLAMTANTSAPGAAYLTWTLPANAAFATPNCAQAGASFVYVYLDGVSPQQGVACESGQTSPGVLLQNLTAGQHTIDVVATDAKGFRMYRKVSTLTVTPAATVSAQYSLDWYAGSLPLLWNFTNVGAPTSCGSAGVTAVDVYLTDAQGQYADIPESPRFTKSIDAQGRVSYRFPCLNSGVQGGTLTYVEPGSWNVFVSAASSTGAPFATNFAAPPVATVTSGNFSGIGFQVVLSR